MEIYYDVDITRKGTKKNYEDGSLIPWETNASFYQLKKAKEYVDEYIQFHKIKTTGIRIVRVKDKDGDIECVDVYMVFI